MSGKILYSSANEDVFIEANHKTKYDLHSSDWHKLVDEAVALLRKNNSHQNAFVEQQKDIASSLSRCKKRANQIKRILRRNMGGVKL